MLSFFKRLEFFAARLNEFAEKLDVMQSQGMNGRSKDAEQNVEGVEQEGGKGSYQHAAGGTGKFVCHIGKEYGGQADGHNPGVGYDVAKRFEQFKGSEKTAAENAYRYNDCNPAEERFDRNGKTRPERIEKEKPQAEYQKNA